MITLKSFETYYIEAIISSSLASIQEKMLIKGSKKKLFYGEQGLVEIFDPKYKKEVLKHKAIGDCFLLGEQYFGQEITSLALNFYFEKPTSRLFSEDLIELWQEGSNSNNKVLLDEFVAHALKELETINIEVTEKIYETLGEQRPVDIQLLIDVMVNGSLEKNPKISWPSLLGQNEAKILPLAFGCWNGNTKNLICEAESSLIYLEFSTS